MPEVRTFVLLLGLALALPSPGSAQVEVSGLADIVFRNSDQEDITNLTFRGHSNFHTSRVRLFFDAAVADNTYLFTQILVDNNDFQLYAAYARLANLAGPYLNLHVGLLPATVGSWGARTYSNRNPLIGVPLLYNAHSALVPGGAAVRTTEDIRTQREVRDNHGLPVIYDACWNSGVEAFGNYGKLGYSLGLLAGSLGKPMQQQQKDIPQVTTHITYYASPSLDFGFSAFLGPYLAEDIFNDDLPEGKVYEDYLSGGGGYEFHFARGHLEIYSEAFYVYWEHPYLENLTATSGYLEARYGLGVQWWVAGRLGFFEPGKITDTDGNKVYWDYPLKRLETGLGYKVNRKVLVKLVSQINRFDETDSYDSEHYALQMSISF